MRSVAFLVLSFLTSLSAAIADDYDAKPVQRAVEKAIPWLEKDMVAWRTTNGCAACHHGPMYVWSVSTAKRAGYSVNQTQLRDYTKWVIESPDARVFPADKSAELLAQSTNAADRMTAAMMGHRNLSQPTLYLAHALNALPADDPLTITGWKKLATHWSEAQMEDGSFAGRKGWPPIFNTPQIHTLTAATALEGRPQNLPLNRDAVDSLDSIRKKTRTFLAMHSADELHQGLVLRLLQASRGDSSEKSSLKDKLIALQRKDGGWAQTVDRDSDALATGQSLYAFHQAGVSDSDPAVRRALTFLVKTQLADGTWPMQSRPNPETGRPADDLNPITYAAAAWATIGMAQHVKAGQQ